MGDTITVFCGQRDIPVVVGKPKTYNELLRVACDLFPRLRLGLSPTGTDEQASNFLVFYKPAGHDGSNRLQKLHPSAWSSVPGKAEVYVLLHPSAWPAWPPPVPKTKAELHFRNLKPGWAQSILDEIEGKPVNHEADNDKVKSEIKDMDHSVIAALVASDLGNTRKYQQLSKMFKVPDKFATSVGAACSNVTEGYGPWDDKVVGIVAWKDLDGEPIYSASGVKVKLQWKEPGPETEYDLAFLWTKCPQAVIKFYQATWRTWGKECVPCGRGWEPNPAAEDQCPACKVYRTSDYWDQGFKVACANLRVIEASKPSGIEYMNKEQDESEGDMMYLSSDEYSEIAEIASQMDKYNIDTPDHSSNEGDDIQSRYIMPKLETAIENLCDYSDDELKTPVMPDNDKEEVKLTQCSADKSISDLRFSKEEDASPAPSLALKFPSTFLEAYNHVIEGSQVELVPATNHQDELEQDKQDDIIPTTDHQDEQVKLSSYLAKWQKTHMDPLRKSVTEARNREGLGPFPPTETPAPEQAPGQHSASSPTASAMGNEAQTAEDTSALKINMLNSMVEAMTNGPAEGGHKYRSDALIPTKARQLIESYLANNSYVYSTLKPEGQLDAVDYYHSILVPDLLEALDAMGCCQNGFPINIGPRNEYLSCCPQKSCAKDADGRPIVKVIAKHSEYGELRTLAEKKAIWSVIPVAPKSF